MQPITRPSFILPDLSRRRFIQALAALGLSPWIKTAQAKLTTQAEVLAGTEFNLAIAETPVNFTGESRMATTVNGSIPAPTLRWREGETVMLHVTNLLAEETSIHWHGILLPYQMDGVPGISFKGIAQGETFTYRFKVRQSGTYWYHSHSGMQEQTGLYGSIIIDPAGTESIQTDGQNVEPISVDEFRIGLAETYDVIVTPEEGTYTIFAQTMDRTGYARGTLAVNADMMAEVPALDKPVSLTIMDMMGGVGAMDHSAHDGMSTGNVNVRVRHASTEYGPSVDMRVDMPSTNLADPGIGLRNNGRRVLTYADLHTIGGSLDPKEPDREIELHLTGNMERYSWSFDGLEFGKSSPLHFRYGEWLRVIFVNDTMMTHPVHLHGMWSDLESPDGHFQVRKHTIIVQPAQRVTFLVTADALGRWALHCHHSVATGRIRSDVKSGKKSVKTSAATAADMEAIPGMDHSRMNHDSMPGMEPSNITDSMQNSGHDMSHGGATSGKAGDMSSLNHGSGKSMSMKRDSASPDPRDPHAYSDGCILT